MNPRRDPERPLPHSAEAEAAILGAILLDAAGTDEAFRRLLPSQFFVHAHQLIYRRIREQVESGKRPDALTDTLCEHGELERIPGGAAAVSALLDGIPQVSQLLSWIEIVEQKALLRSLIYATDSIKQTALEAEEDSDALLDRARLALDSITSSRPINWRPMFHIFEDLEKAPPLRMAIRQVIQLDAATALGALAGHGKTWLQSGIGGAMLRGPGTKLWGLFDDLEPVTRVLYLIPESTLGPLPTAYEHSVCFLS